MITAEQQLALELLSVHYTPTPFIRLLAALEVSLQRRLDRPTLQGWLDALQEQDRVEFFNKRWRCAPRRVEQITAEVTRSGRLPALVSAMLLPVDLKSPYLSRESQARAKVGFREEPGDAVMRKLRVAMHTRDVATFQQLMNDAHPSCTCYSQWERVHPLKSMLGCSFDAAWMDTLPDGIISAICGALGETGISALDDWLEAWLRLHREHEHDSVRFCLGWRAAIRGRLPDAESLIGSRPGVDLDCLRAALATMQGRYSAAVKQFERARDTFRAVTSKRTANLRCPAAALYPIALVGCGRVSEARALTAAVLKETRQPLRSEHKWLAPSLEVLESAEPSDDAVFGAFNCADKGLVRIFAWLLPAWSPNGQKVATRSALAYVAEHHTQQGEHWLSAEMAAVLARLEPDSKWVTIAAQASAAWGTVPLVDASRGTAVWERQLSALERVTVPQAPSTVTGLERSERLVWQMSREIRGSVTPLVQKRNARSGQWTGGRPIALSKLRSDPPAFLTEADLALCRCIRDRYGALHLDVAEMLPSLVDHPLVFCAATSVPIQVMAGNPSLKIGREGESLWLEIEPQRACMLNQRIGAHRVSETELRVYRLTEIQASLSALLPGRCAFPPEARERLGKLLKKLGAELELRWDGGEATRRLLQDPLADSLLACLLAS